MELTPLAQPGTREEVGEKCFSKLNVSGSPLSCV